MAVKLYTLGVRVEEMVITPVLELTVNSGTEGVRVNVSWAFDPKSLSLADNWRTLVPGGVVSTSCVKYDAWENCGDSLHQAHLPQHWPVKTVWSSAKDEDEGSNGALQFSLSSSDFFNVDPTSGALVVRSQLDREMVASIQFVVVVMDEGKTPPTVVPMAMFSVTSTEKLV